MRRLHKLPFLFLLILCLLAGPATSFGYIWCTCADGHTTLEGVSACDFCERLQAPRAIDWLAFALMANTDNCGPCREIPTTTRWSSVPTFSTEDSVNFPESYAPFIVAKHHPLSYWFLTNHLIIDPTRCTPSSIVQQRTSVLLI